MGTRGAFGYRLGGIDKLQYNHYDSYPEGVGQTIVENLLVIMAKGPASNGEVIPRGIDDLVQRVADLRLVKEGGEDKPTTEEVQRAQELRLTDLGVGSQSDDDWYCVLRNGQPYPAGIWPILEMGVMIHGNDFVSDSLFCEWAYVINLDEMVFEVYRGFQAEPHTAGRYATSFITYDSPLSASKYYPIALVKAYPLDGIKMWAPKWQAEVHKLVHKD